MEDRPVRRTSLVAGGLGSRVLLTLFIIALVLRVIGILWGGKHPDENFGAPARMLSGQVVPDYHYYPPFYYYLNAISFGLMFLGGKISGIWPNVAAFKEHYFMRPEAFWIAARLVAATLGALSAPIAARLARHVGLGLRASFWVGVFVAFLPVNVLYSHVSKGDTGLAAAMLFLTLMHFRFIDNPRSILSSAAMGFAAAVAVSFKQSAVFYIVPLAILGLFYLIYLFISRKISFGNVAKLLGTYFAVGTVVWIPLNIGIILDLRNFIESQYLIDLMVQRPTGHMDNVIRALVILSGNISGATYALFFFWFLAPFVLRDFKALSMWCATAFGIATIVYVAGGYAKPDTYLPYSVLITVSAGMSAWYCLERLSGRARQAMLVVLFIMGAVLARGTFEVCRQALGEPLGVRLTRAVEEVAEPEKTRILGGLKYLNFSIDPTAREDEYARHERLAEKYGVALPDRGSGRVKANRAVTAPYYYVRSLPVVIGGLERYEEEEIKVIKPFSWPLQKEEFQMQYWIDKDFTVFIAFRQERFLHSDIDAIRKFHEQMVERCDLIDEIPATRNLFGESDARIYRLKD